MMSKDYSLLQFTNFSGISRWSADYLVSNIFSKNFSLKVRLSDVLKRQKNVVIVEDEVLYKRIKIRQYGLGVLLRDEVKGSEIRTKRQFMAKQGQLIISRIDARNGSFGIVPKELDGAIVTNDFWLFDVHNANIHYLLLLLSSDNFQNYWQSKSNGTTNRQRVDETDFLNSEISLPSFEEQYRIVYKYNQVVDKADKLKQEAMQLENSIDKVLFNEAGIEDITQNEKLKSRKLLFTTMYSEITQWGVDKISSKLPYKFNKYSPTTLEKNPKIYIDIFRGKSPEYSDISDSIILNQKCNRWNEIDLQHAKTVSKNWLSKINPEIFTQEGDILINSTGEGTLGRASGITKENETGLLFDSHLLLLRLHPQYINYLFFVFLFNSKLGQYQINSLKGAQATKQTELGVENVKKILLPLPPLDVQKGIVQKIQNINNIVKAKRQQALELRRTAKRDFERSVFGETN
jgi:restriction endonuclease S subunit